MSREIDGDDRRNNDLVTVEFTKKQFSEFVLTHIQTPSEEFRTLEGGFDIDKDTIKSIIDKIHYYVRVNNELLHWEVSFSAYTDGNTFQKISSYGDFFNIDRFDEQFFSALGVTISFLVRFGGDELRPPEKQTVDLLFISEKVSKLRVAARTTEFTWATPVMELVTREFKKLNNRVERDS